jgi:hypothetical protein
LYDSVLAILRELTMCLVLIFYVFLLTRYILLAKASKQPNTQTGHQRQHVYTCTLSVTPSFPLRTAQLSFAYSAMAISPGGRRGKEDAESSLPASRGMPDGESAESLQLHQYRTYRG